MRSARSWLWPLVFLVATLAGMSAAVAAGTRTGGAAGGTRLVLQERQEILSADQHRLAVRSYLVYRIADPDRAHRAFADTAVLETRLTVLMIGWNRRIIGESTVPDLDGAGRDRIAARIVEGINRDSRTFGVEVIEHGFLSIAPIVSP